MFRVEFAPDAVYQLEQLMTQQLEDSGKAGAYDLLEKLEGCIAALREDPVSGGVHINGIPRRYRMREAYPGIFLIYQIEEEKARVNVDAILEKRADRNF